MLNRPRCRDWSPLATQQLRLRNLIQITGHNIAADPKSSIYFTLHLTSMSAPFFTSEKLESFKNAIWAEINCQTINKSTSQFVCVRVWQSIKHHKTEEPCAEHNAVASIQPTPKTSCSHDLSMVDLDARSEQKHSSSVDKIVFMWGVYLSGLVPISKRSDVKLKTNGLVFYMHGGFFTSTEYLQPECIPKQYNYFHHVRREFYNNEQVNLTNTTTSNGKKNNTYKNCDSLVSFNNLNGAEHNSYASLISATHAAFSESSPNRFIDPNAFADGVTVIGHGVAIDDMNCQEELRHANALKMRYINKEFFKMEIRNSYNVKKLLLLQEKQRIFRNKTISSNEVVEKICMRSAFCLNLKLIANKGMFYRPRGNPSIGRTLNRLLTAQPEQPKPEDLLKAQELRRRIEGAKFRCRFLTMERDRHKVNLRKLQNICGKLSDENIDKESSLMANYRELSRNREIAFEQNAIFMRQSKLYESVRELIEYRQKQLLVQLRDIYSIDVGDETHRFYKINGIYLPNAEQYMDVSNSHFGAVQTSASSICVALGYVAHIVLLCSTILNIPLRNRIIYYGSASKIRDDIKVLSEHDREFPLFCRNVPPTDSLLYAVFLLNQNISQIKFLLNVHSHREDIRATLPNLFEILNAAENAAHDMVNAPSTTVTTLSISHEHDAPMSSVSDSSIDIIFPVPLKKTYSASDNNLNGSETTISGNKLGRNNGSCSDEQLTRRRERLNRASSALGPRFYSEPILQAEATLRYKVLEN